MDEVDKLVDKLIETIKKGVDANDLNNSFLNYDVAEFCTRFGYEEAQLFLKQSPKESKRRIKALLKVLHFLREIKVPEDVGALVFRKLNAIKLVVEKDEKV